MCKRVRVKKDLVGGMVKAGQTIYAYHRFRIYVPDPESGSPPKQAMGFEFDGQLWDQYFEIVQEQAQKGGVAG
jgi:hypothetical protein